MADAGGGTGGNAVSAPLGEIRSREDAVRMMDRVAEYFERNEPSSPVPVLLRRTKRLVSMSFLDILRDLTPDGVAQAESIGGVSKSEE
jgi:type VI secretion system protein ImpA